MATPTATLLQTAPSKAAAATLPVPTWKKVAAVVAIVVAVALLTISGFGLAGLAGASIGAFSAFCVGAIGSGVGGGVMGLLAGTLFGIYGAILLKPQSAVEPTDTATEHGNGRPQVLSTITEASVETDGAGSVQDLQRRYQRLIEKAATVVFSPESTSAQREAEWQQLQPVRAALTELREEPHLTTNLHKFLDDVLRQARSPEEFTEMVQMVRRLSIGLYQEAPQLRASLSQGDYATLHRLLPAIRAHIEASRMCCTLQVLCTDRDQAERTWEQITALKKLAREELALVESGVGKCPRLSASGLFERIARHDNFVEELLEILFHNASSAHQFATAVECLRK